MPTFQITAPDGKQYRISGENAEGAMSALQQHLGSASSAVPAEQSAPTPDKYQQAAIDERDHLKAQGADTGAGYTRRVAHGATFGADNTILAGLMTPLEMIKRGTFSPSEGYNYAKAREDLILDDARKNTGALGAALEIGGGIGSGVGLARGGVTFARNLAPNASLVSRSLASAGDAAGMGAFSGAMEGNGLAERGENALKGATVGGIVGGAAPGVIGLLGNIAAPITSNIRARVNPEGFAQSQVARAISESGLTPQQIGQRVVDANAEGSPFMVADAMGNAGQRLLSTVARAPGEGRTAVVNALESRQAGQGRRVANALAEGFDSSRTAAQTEAALTRARDTAANAEFGAVRNDATPVDITSVIRNIDATLGPRTAFGTDIANDTAEAALARVRARLTDGRSNLTEFNAVQRVRGDLSDAVESARRAGQGNKARLLGGALRELDRAMEVASPGFRQANANFARASRAIDTVGQGRDAAMRGRTEDIVPAFRAMPADRQDAFRAGYVDPLIAHAQGSAFGVNKARPLLNDAFADEAAAIAPMRTQTRMMNRLNNEQTMFETRNHALGGSRTADNLNDHAATGVDPQIVGQIVTGNWSGALRSALNAGSNVLTGNTPAVRQEIANILLQRGVTGRALDQMVGATVQRLQFIQNMARNMGRGASGGLAVAVPGQNRR